MDIILPFANGAVLLARAIVLGFVTDGADHLTHIAPKTKLYLTIASSSKFEDAAATRIA